MSNSTAAFLSVLSFFISVVVAVITYITYRTHKRSGDDNAYFDVDNQYSKLLKLAMKYPDMRDHDKTAAYYRMPPDDVFVKRYNIYAYMSWNVVETIFDKQKGHLGKEGEFHLDPTWEPVLKEENRLHYTWFTHNLDLFKEPFQEFVKVDLNGIDVVPGNDQKLSDEIYPRFEADFPAEERVELKHLKRLITNGDYELLLADHKTFKNMTLGYAFVYHVSECPVLWLDYMAIDKKYQNAGYGSKLFNRILELNKNALGMFMEVEIPNSADEQELCNQKRRIAFYERQGAVRLNLDYIFPSQSGGVPMYLFFKPAPSCHRLDKKQIAKSINSAFKFIHSDVPNANQILESFIDTIEDVHFDIPQNQHASVR